jgi:hypothetical protein
VPKCAPGTSPNAYGTKAAPFAAAGAAWIDAFMLGPRLIEAGHTPAQAEDLLATVPAWREAPATVMDGLLAAWTLFRVYQGDVRRRRGPGVPRPSRRGWPRLAGPPHRSRLTR